MTCPAAWVCPASGPIEGAGRTDSNLVRPDTNRTPTGHALTCTNDPDTTWTHPHPSECPESESGHQSGHQSAEPRRPPHDY